jgi:hypothetical protein
VMQRKSPSFHESAAMVARLLPNRRKMRPRSCRNEVAVSLSRKRGGSQEAHLVHSGHLGVQPGTDYAHPRAGSWKRRGVRLAARPAAALPQAFRPQSGLLI